MLSLPSSAEHVCRHVIKGLNGDVSLKVTLVVMKIFIMEIANALSTAVREIQTPAVCMQSWLCEQPHSLLAPTQDGNHREILSRLCC